MASEAILEAIDPSEGSQTLILDLKSLRMTILMVKTLFLLPQSTLTAHLMSYSHCLGVPVPLLAYQIGYRSIILTLHIL